MTVTTAERGLEALETSELERMRQAGRDIRYWGRILAKTNANIVGEVLKGQGTFFEWDHYPKGDVYDPESGAQYYYHAHPKQERDGEHGHFHTFLRTKGMPKSVKPLSDQPPPPPANEGGRLSHLIGISMDPPGFPIKLFTTNRWVTGETWYPAQDVIAMLDRFDMATAHPSWPTNRWITSMIALFKPQIVALIEARDAAVADWRNRMAPEDVFEDRRLEITSEQPVSVDKQIAAVDRAVCTRG